MILPFVTDMHMDEKGQYQLSNFHGKLHKGRVTESDHAMVQLHVNLQFVVQKPQRTEAFNFKNSESIMCRWQSLAVTVSMAQLSPADLT